VDTVAEKTRMKACLEVYTSQVIRKHFILKDQDTDTSVS